MTPIKYIQCIDTLKGPTHSIVVILGKQFQTELVAEILPKSIDRAIGKVLLMKY